MLVLEYGSQVSPASLWIPASRLTQCSINITAHKLSSGASSVSVQLGIITRACITVCRVYTVSPRLKSILSIVSERFCIVFHGFDAPKSLLNSRKFANATKVQLEWKNRLRKYEKRGAVCFCYDMILWLILFCCQVVSTADCVVFIGY